MRVLITGITGFAGGHLAEALLARGGADLHGLSRKAEWPLEWQHLAGTVQIHAQDLMIATDLHALLAAIQPDWIFHLAGYAHAGRSFAEADAAWQGNLQATRNFYEAIARWGARPRILYVSSGLIYGEADAPDAPCSESQPLRPASPYAASKAAADLASFQYSRFPGLDIVRVRPFNHIGPRQQPAYAIPGFASQIAAIERGRQPPVVETGDLNSRRDLTDVRDMVRAYIHLLEKGKTGEVYNAGSGTAYRMRDVLDKLLAISKVQVTVRPRAPETRPREMGVARADYSKLQRETGWRPNFSLEQTLADTLEYWRMTMEKTDHG
ncbi:MAG TPA: GDP-mannose 4,6-dehydratase [Gemmataceae bacterium]|jgi:GDP-4-dehydro-6-deoxy-D-mannose reductase|nr:GDP-mannose 4,6-dehydratase [Gemmataceae bacterium]